MLVIVLPRPRPVHLGSGPLRADEGRRPRRFTTDHAGWLLVTEDVQLESSVHLVLILFTSVRAISDGGEGTRARHFASANTG